MKVCHVVMFNNHSFHPTYVNISGLSCCNYRLLPSSMVQCIATFMDACYIAHCNAITGPSLEHFQSCVKKFHTLQNIFIEAGIRASISLPCQHALFHYFYSIHLFGSPNGLCSSITESKHIKAVKEPWHRSSRYHALIQMLWTLVHLDKMETLQHAFSKMGMLAGTASSYIMQMKAEENESSLGFDKHVDYDEESEDDEGGPASGTLSGAMSDVKLATKCGMYIYWCPICSSCTTGIFTESRYPAVTFTNLQNISTNPSFHLSFAAFSSCTTTQISSHLQNTITTMAYGRPSDTSPESWYEAAKNMDQNRVANEAFKSAYQAPASTPTRLTSIPLRPIQQSQSFLESVQIVLFGLVFYSLTHSYIAHTLKLKNCLCLRVKSKFITLLSQYTMHQVIYVEQVVYIVNTFTQLHLSMGMNAVIQFLWFLMSQKVG